MEYCPNERAIISWSMSRTELCTAGEVTVISAGRKTGRHDNASARRLTDDIGRVT
jgi:hypothetical protein